MADRTEVIGGIWADGAPDVSGSAVLDVTYGKTDISAEEIEDAWAYGRVVDSAIHNEMIRRLTTLMVMLEENGVLPWCAATEYASGALAMGSDGYVYTALSAHDNQAPTSAPTYWTRIQGSGSLAVSGYWKLKGGLVIQWATGAATSAGATITLPVVFPHAIFSVVMTPSADTTPPALAITDGSTTNFKAWSSETSSNMCYIALGY